MEKERKKKIYICKEDRILIVPFPLARDLYRLPFVYLPIIRLMIIGGRFHA